MRWPLPFLLGYLLLALESPVREALRLGPTSSSPSLVFPLVVFVALLASAPAALWTALLIGLAVDLSTLRAAALGDPIVIVGPHALGYLLAAYTILTIRPIVMRKNPVTLVVLSIVGEILASIVVVAILGLRQIIFRGSWADGLGLSLTSDLWHRIIGSCYTAAAAILLAALFFPLFSWFGFQDQSARRPFARRY
jgi:hypothetical protein